MSRAFVREPDAGTPAEPLPDIAVPPPPNPVTPRGLALIEAEIAGIEAQLHGAAEPAPLRRKLRYWAARRATARVTPPPGDPDEVGFGSRVTVAWPGRGTVAMTIVGEDETDPAAGRIGWRAPTVAALIGNRAGDTVQATIGGRELGLAILAVDNSGP